MTPREIERYQDGELAEAEYESTGYALARASQFGMALATSAALGFGALAFFGGPVGNSPVGMPPGGGSVPGGVSGGGGNVTVVASSFDVCGDGPNLPAGMTRIFCLDVTQNDQASANTLAASFLESTRWTTPETSPNNGAFFNETCGDTTCVRFIWKIGQNERAANIEVSYADEWCTSYSRVTLRLNSAWEQNGGTLKHLFYGNSGAGSGANVAPSFLNLNAGNAALINSDPNVTGSTGVTNGEWVDVETVITNHGLAAPDSSTVTIYVNGTLDVTGKSLTWQTTPTSPNLLNVGPFHGGNGAKTRVDTVEVSRMVVHRTACS